MCTLDDITVQAQTIADYHLKPNGDIGEWDGREPVFRRSLNYFCNNHINQILPTFETLYEVQKHLKEGKAKDEEVA